MTKVKEIYDSAFTLDDLIQESLEMNNFLKGKTNQPFHNDNYLENLFKFFSQNIKLQNASKNICWAPSTSTKNVSKNEYKFLLDI